LRTAVEARADKSLLVDLQEALSNFDFEAALEKLNEIARI